MRQSKWYFSQHCNICSVLLCADVLPKGCLHDERDKAGVTNHEATKYRFDL